MKGYQVNVLGTFQCTYNGQPLKKIPTGKMQLLFVYLLLHMDRPIDRKEIAFLLWPESTDQQSQTNLRKLLHHLRKILPKSADYLELEDGQMMWKSANGCIVDAVEFTKLANERDSRVNLSKAVSMYRGQLLPGVHVDWVIQHREELFLKYADIIQVLVKMCERMREYKQAIDYAYKILSYDPLDEKIHQLLIRLHLLNGNHSGMSTLNCTV